jgi:hypothetical protein
MSWIETAGAVEHQQRRTGPNFGQLEIDACDINHTT